MKNNYLVIPAAGRGSRSGLSYPKTLYKFNSKPILINIIENVLSSKIFIKKIIIIVSPKGKYKIQQYLKQYKLLNLCELIIQYQPKGMAHAVMQLKKSSFINRYSNILLIWGDVANPQKTSVNKLFFSFTINYNDFAFLSKFVSKPYTLVIRNKKKVTGVIETKGNKTINYGERDVGIFIFKYNKIFKFLNYITSNKNSNLNEQSFLNIINKLVKENNSVEGYPQATKTDIISLNRISDIK